MIQGVKYLNSDLKILHFNLKPDSIRFTKDFNNNLVPKITSFGKYLHITSDDMSEQYQLEQDPNYKKD